MKAIISQFGHPRGLLGRLAGAIMARSNASRYDWAISLLDPQPSESVLEIGFGPGVGIQKLAGRVDTGLVAGVDVSEIMLTVAARRNAAAVRAGRVELHQGSVAQIPYPAQTFERVLSSNSIPFWTDPIAGLAELRRVMRPDARIATLLQPRWVRSDPEVRAVAGDIRRQHELAGFEQIQVEYKPMKPMMAFCVLASAPAGI